MRIAGINSPNYHHNQPHKPKNSHSTAEGDQAGVTQTDSQPSAAPASGEIQNNPIVAHQQGALMQPSANDLTGNSENFDARVNFYSAIGNARNGASPESMWNSYNSGGEASGAVPDNTSHKARSAISEYLQTQFIEERNRFTEALGVDEYA
jgi:hypothetical protein